MQSSRKSLFLGSAAAMLTITGLAGCQTQPKNIQSPILSGKVEQEKKLTNQQMADMKFAVGRAWEGRGNSDQAVASYLEAVKLDPSRADAYLRLAAICDDQAKWSEATGYYEKARHAQPNNPNVYCNLGYSYYLRSHYPEAEKNLRHALTINPDLKCAHNNLGFVVAQTGRKEESLAEFRKAGCSEPDAHVNLAFALTVQKNWPEAREQYEQALAFDPTSESAKKGLAELDHLNARSNSAPTIIPVRGEASILN